jgi:hypothetical protein
MGPLVTRWGSHKPPLGVQLDRSHPLAHGLIGLYAFNEGGGSRVTDLAGNGHGTLSSPAAWAATPAGMAMNVANGYCGIGDHEPLELANNFTIEALVCMAGNGSWAGIFTKAAAWSTATPKYAFYTSSNTRRPAWVTAGQGEMLHGTALTLGKWHHVAATRVVNGANETITIYVDGGNPLAGTRGISAVTYSTEVVNVGAWANGAGSGNWPGYIAKASAYNRALTGAEIAWLHAEPYAMFQPIKRRAYSVAAAATGNRRRRMILTAA